VSALRPGRRGHVGGLRCSSPRSAGYARCSTDRQDVQAQRTQLATLGVDAQRVYVDEGLSGANRARPGLREAFAACRAGDTLVVTKLDRFARSTADAHDLLDELSRTGVKFAMGGSVYDWADPFGRMFLQILSVVAEFELNLVRMRTREGMAVAKAKGKLRGKQPKLPPTAQRTIAARSATGEVSLADLADEYSVSRTTIHRVLHRRPTLTT